jgi:type IV secretory pathway VirB4 component
MKLGNDAVTFMPVFVKDKDRFKHVFQCGKTGTGKSLFLLYAWQNDSWTKIAKILIDPSGFLAKDAYSVMKGKAHYCSLETPISLNPMIAPYKPFQIADIIAETVNQMVAMTTPNQKFTVKMREILNAEVVKCIELGRTTLEEVKANLEAQRGNAETRDGVIARLNLILQDPDFREIICGQTTFEINRLIENQESFILDCCGMGYDKKVFVGSLLTNLVKSYFIYARPKKYQPLILVVDECHNFLSQDFSLVLKEGRKYEISAVMATTDFSSIPSSLIHTILSNVGTLICLRAGYVEASMISREFQNFTASDIQGLEKYQAVVKTPETEAIVKLPRPIFVKPVAVKPAPAKKKTFDLEWFDLPSYCFQLDYEPDGAVVGDGRRCAHETPPASTEGG